MNDFRSLLDASTEAELAEKLEDWLGDDLTAAMFKRDAEFAKYVTPRFYRHISPRERELDLGMLSFYKIRRKDELAEAFEYVLNGKVPSDKANWLVKTLAKVPIYAENYPAMGYVAVLKYYYDANGIYGESGVKTFIKVKYSDTSYPPMNILSEIAPLVIAYYNGGRLTKKEYLQVVRLEDEDLEIGKAVWDSFLNRFEQYFDEFGRDYFVLKEAVE